MGSIDGIMTLAFARSRITAELGISVTGITGRSSRPFITSIIGLVCIKAYNGALLHDQLHAPSFSKSQSHLYIAFGSP